QEPIGHTKTVSDPKRKSVILKLESCYSPSPRNSYVQEGTVRIQIGQGVRTVSAGGASAIGLVTRIVKFCDTENGKGPSRRRSTSYFSSRQSTVTDKQAIS